MGRKYLFVINSFLAGGAERSLVEMLPRLVDEGVTPIIACLNYREVGFEEEVREAGYDVRLLEGKNRMGKIRSLRKLIKEEQPDLVYTSLFDADMAGRFATVGLDVPVMSNLANTAYDPARLADPNVDERKLRVVQWIDGLTSRHMTDHFHAVSQAVKDSTVETLGVDPDKITVVKRGRDSDRLGVRTAERSAAAREALDLSADDEVVVTVGRQEYQKGHRYLIEAFAGVVADRPHAKLLITGREGHATEELQGLVSDLGLDGTVRLLGHRSDVPEVLAASDVFVFPSLYEGLGGALIEALGLALPVVASDLPALREVVREGENADLVPPRDVAALREAITGLLADPDRRARYAAHSRTFFEEEFLAEDATERMVAMLSAQAGETAEPEEPPPPPVGNAELTAVLLGMQDRKGPVASADAWSVGANWRSFKADFVRADSNEGSVAVKFGDGWTAEEAHFVHDEEERVRRIFAELPAGAVQVPAALGWSDVAGAIALEFVEGATLFHVLGDGSYRSWNQGEIAMVSLIEQCGQAIGAYHNAQPAIDDPATTQVALDDLYTATRRAGYRKPTILEIEPRLTRARGYRFSPNDFLVRPDHRLVMLDPPHVQKYDYLQRDVSAFTYELHRALIGDGPMSADHPNRELLGRLRTAFLGGYAATGPEPLDTALDRWMIRFYELSRVTGLAYARIRSRKVAAAAAPLRWAAQIRRSLGDPPGKTA